MIGTKFNKPLEDLQGYAECASWCNENGAMIMDKGDYYECVVIPPLPLKDAKAIAQATVRDMLSATDYKCLKYVDGELTEDDYADTKAERAWLRELFNLIESADSVEDIQALLEEVSDGGSD